MSEPKQSEPHTSPTRRLRTRTITLLLAGWVIGLTGFVFTNKAIVYAGTNDFCGTACHTMQPAYETYKRSVHFANASGVPATCSDCHIVNESARNIGAWQWLQLVAFKARVGVTDVVDEMRGTIATPEKWAAERARLEKQVHAFVKRTDSSTCRGCHDLSAFSPGAMSQLVHADVIKTKGLDCLSCHSGIAHGNDKSARVVSTAGVERPSAPSRPKTSQVETVQGAAPGPTTAAVERQPALGEPQTSKIETIPSGPTGDMARLGKEIFLDTPGNSLSHPFVGREDRKSCGTCHGAAGTDLDNLPLIGAAAAYPALVGGRMMTLQGRIANCFVRHLDGTQPPSESQVLRALDAYITWLSEGQRRAANPSDGGTLALGPTAPKAPVGSRTNVAAGKSLYSAKCASCHGSNGEGASAQAVWGPKAFNKSAALAGAERLAAYLTTTMAKYSGPITAEQGRDLAAFIDSQPRPGAVQKDNSPRP